MDKIFRCKHRALSPNAEAGAVPFWAEKPSIWRYLRSISETDPLKQGYGPHFILILALALVVGSHLIGRLIQSRAKHALTTLTLVYLIWLVACTLVNPEFWWARYLPQLWTAPFLLCALAVAAKREIAAILLAAPLAISFSIFVFCFFLLMERKVQMENLTSQVLQGHKMLRVADIAGNSRHLFVAAAFAAEHGMRLVTVPVRECTVVRLPMVDACTQ